MESLSDDLLSLLFSYCRYSALVNLKQTKKRFKLLIEARYQSREFNYEFIPHLNLFNFKFGDITYSINNFFFADQRELDDLDDFIYSFNRRREDELIIPDQDEEDTYQFLLIEDGKFTYAKRTVLSKSAIEIPIKNRELEILKFLYLIQDLGFLYLEEEEDEEELALILSKYDK